MAVIAAEEIPGILTGLGWSPRTIDERTWRCTIATPAGDARIVVRHAGTWLYLAVIPFLDAEVIRPWGAGKFPPRFLGRILAVNNNLVLVKFALDEDGDLSLRVELPTESLQRREVETALQLLLRTTEQYRSPIREALLDASRNSTSPGPAESRDTQDIAEADIPSPRTESPTTPPAEPTPATATPPAEPTAPPAEPATPPDPGGLAPAYGAPPR